MMESACSGEIWACKDGMANDTIEIKTIEIFDVSFMALFFNQFFNSVSSVRVFPFKEI